jgi:hypothetical protein
MAKRFTDSEKWDDPFFADLPNKYKMFWLYVLDKCDHAGFYKVNLKMAAFILGEKYDPVEILCIFAGRIKELTPEKWFIPKFISFQYGDLNDESRVHKSVLKTLKKEGITKECLKGVDTLKDKDKNKDKDKDKDKEKDIYISYDNFQVIKKLFKGDKDKIKHHLLGLDFSEAEIDCAMGKNY